MSPLVLELHVQPGAKRTELAGIHGERIKVRLAAPPVEGKANDALIAFLARALDVPRRNVAIQSGLASRHKRVAIDGVDDARKREFLQSLGQPLGKRASSG